MALGLVKNKNDDQVREAGNVFEPVFVFLEYFDLSLDVIEPVSRGAEFPWDILSFLERGMDNSDRL
jgi:hypothetical protein